MNTLRSLWLWFAVSSLIVIWLPLVAAVRVFDRDPGHYRTGYWFRLLGRLITRIDPGWLVEIDGVHVEDPRRPYVVVCNHQSLADIPVVSCLPWDMKWVAKRELFRVPILGWMMRLAGDIPLEREDRRSGARALIRAREYLQQRCSVFFFPEGTRSREGEVGTFNEGAFHLAIRSGVPVLPLAIEGAGDLLPRHGWRFGPTTHVRLRVLAPIPTTGLVAADVPALRDRVRTQIVDTVAAWRREDVGRAEKVGAVRTVGGEDDSG